MKQVYISGALTNLPNADEIKRFYEAIGDVCKRVGLHTYIPHLHTDPIKDHAIPPTTVFNTDKSTVISSDLVIAYLGIPSLGVGMELAYAEMHGIGLILMYEKGKKISRFARGVPSIVKSIEFSTYDEGLAELEDFLRNFLAEE